jgi:hypothetical protein
MMKIEFTKEEAQALVGLIDLAVKSGGLQVANAALVIMKKIDDAAKESSKEETK